MDSLPFSVKIFFCSAQEYMNETWTFYDLHDGQITAVNDKAPPKPPFLGKADKCNFFVGVFKLSDGACFKKCLEATLRAAARDMDSFYSTLMLYGETHGFSSCAVKEWFDIGHAQLYFKTRIKEDRQRYRKVHRRD